MLVMVRFEVLTAVLLLWTSFVDAAPSSLLPRARDRHRKLTPQEGVSQIPTGITQAKDGSTVIDDYVQVNGLDIRFKISAPAAHFVNDSGILGAAAHPRSQGPLGINVLLHGDGGQSFFDFPNAGVRNGLMGVALLAPDPNLHWGGGSGLDRVDGVAHAQAVKDFVVEVLPEMVAFNASDVFFTGVSGGSLLLSGFLMPAHMGDLAGQGQQSGVLLNCGAMVPQVNVTGASAAALATTRIHYQSSQQELELLQSSIPAAIAAYETVAAGGKGQALQTVNNSPPGGHCEFDGKGFSSGVQLMADNFAAVMQGGDGDVKGIGNVLGAVAGNETLRFSKQESRFG